MGPDISFKEAKSSVCLFVVISICLIHERSSAIVTPKYFAVGTLSSSTLCKTKQQSYKKNIYIVGDTNSITLAMSSYLPTYKLRQVYMHTSTTHIIS